MICLELSCKKDKQVQSEPRKSRQIGDQEVGLSSKIICTSCRWSMLIVFICTIEGGHQSIKRLILAPNPVNRLILTTIPLRANFGPPIEVEILKNSRIKVHTFDKCMQKSPHFFENEFQI